MTRRSTSILTASSPRSAPPEPGWKEENAEAVADCHKWIEENGMPLCRFRKV